jgi:hypothetical protein
MPCVNYAECHKEAIYAECYYAGCRYAECCGAKLTGNIDVSKNFIFGINPNYVHLHNETTGMRHTLPVYFFCPSVNVIKVL